MCVSQTSFMAPCHARVHRGKAKRTIIRSKEILFSVSSLLETLLERSFAYRVARFSWTLTLLRNTPCRSRSCLVIETSSQAMWCQHVGDPFLCIGLDLYAVRISSNQVFQSSPSRKTSVTWSVSNQFRSASWTTSQNHENLLRKHPRLCMPMLHRLHRYHNPCLRSQQTQSSTGALYGQKLWRVPSIKL